MMKIKILIHKTLRNLDQEVLNGYNNGMFINIYILAANESSPSTQIQEVN